MTNIELLRSLAKEAAEIKNGDTVDGVTSTRKSSISFKLTLAEYPDFIVTKIAPRATKHLIVMPSAGTCFIKTEDSSGQSSEILTAELYSNFSNGMPAIELPEGFWGKTLTKGKAMGARIVDLFSNPSLMELLRKRKINEDLLVIPEKYSEPPESKYVEAFKNFPHLFLEYLDKPKAGELLLREPIFAKSIVDLFGIQNARDFLTEYEESLVSLIDGKNYYRKYCNRLTRRSVQPFEFPINGRQDVSVIPRVRLKYSSFRDYVLYDSVRMGFGLDGSDFFIMWNDTLSMEYQIYGKITDKYPTDLLLIHNQLQYKCTLMKQQLDERKFALQVEAASMYEGTYKDFVFVAPQCKQDFLDEATSQSNCLAGYISSFTEGRCLILFMREKKEPEQSYITVEIVDGDVVQAKLARNKEPSVADKAILYEWVDKCNKKAEKETADIVA